MTTDTALLVSHEILEGKKEYSTLKFVDDPDIPMGDAVKRYLDIKMPLKSIAEGKESDISKADEHISAFSESIALSEEPEIADVKVMELTCMEGFRYRIDDTKYPNFNGKNSLANTKFPIIPIGMLDIWRQDQAEDNMGDFL